MTLKFGPLIGSKLYDDAGLTSPVGLADGGTGAALTDPNADRIMFWDDSAGAIDWLIAGTGLTITDKTITASGFSWGASISGTTTGGVTLTLSDSSDSGAIAQSIVMGNTQSNALIGQKIDLGTSARAHVGLLINAYNANTGLRGLKIDKSTAGTGLGLEITGGAVGDDINNGIASMLYLHNDEALAVSTNSMSMSKYSWGNISSVAAGGMYAHQELTCNYKLSDTNSRQINQYLGVYFGASNGEFTFETADTTVQHAAYYACFTGGVTSTQKAAGLLLVSKSDNYTHDVKGVYQSYIDSSTTLTVRTTDCNEFKLSRENKATSGTIADNYNTAYIKRTSIQNGAGGTLTAAGSVLKLENVATQTAGTLTDTTSVLVLAQGALTSTHFKKLIDIAGVTLWTSDGTTANGNLSGTAGDICFNAGSNKPEYCTGTTTWVALV